MFFDGGSVHPYGSFWLDFADKAIKGAAVLVGGAWTLINFERSRTFRRRLEPKVAAQIFKAGPDYFLLTTSRLKNIGQSKYPIRRRGTVVEVESIETTGRKRLRVSRVFDKHGWVEPGEEIEHSLIFPVPDPSKVVAFEVSLRVVSEDETDTEAIEWNASCVASAYFADGSLGGDKVVDKTASKASGPEVQTKEER
jgi:hypothetical protein